jgi:hypothetical protein
MIDALDRAEAYLEEAGMLGLPGGVLYSGVESLKRGPVYLLGLNPGGSEGATLKDSIDGSRRGHNAYLDEEWAPGGNVQPKGQATLQRRIQHLCKMMGCETRDVPASNLAFTRSVRLGAHNDFPAAVKACLPVHEIFLDAIQPDFLMTFGSIDYFAQAFKIDSIESRLADHGNWQAHRGFASVGGRSFAFGNVPHMSLWASDKREHILSWVLEFQTRQAPNQTEKLN